MRGSPSADPQWPLVLHLVGAAVFALMVLWQVCAVFLTPVDLFIHHTYLVEELRRFSVFGLIFYGFSLVMLRFCVVPNVWGVLYAVSSWLLFIVAFYPTLPLGSRGMMRRVANPAEYEATRQSFVQVFQGFRAVATLGFGAIQAALLCRAYRELRAREISSEEAG